MNYRTGLRLARAPIGLKTWHSLWLGPERRGAPSFSPQLLGVSIEPRSPLRIKLLTCKEVMQAMPRTKHEGIFQPATYLASLLHTLRSPCKIRTNLHMRRGGTLSGPTGSRFARSGPCRPPKGKPLLFQEVILNPNNFASFRSFYLSIGNYLISFG